MNKENLLKFFEQEYNNAKRVLDESPWYVDKEESVYRGLSRCYGVVMFLEQYCNDAISHEEIENAFNEVRDKFSVLIDMANM